MRDNWFFPRFDNNNKKISKLVSERVVCFYCLPVGKYLDWWGLNNDQSISSRYNHGQTHRARETFYTAMGHFIIIVAVHFFFWFFSFFVFFLIFSRLVLLFGRYSFGLFIRREKLVTRPRYIWTLAPSWDEELAGKVRKRWKRRSRRMHIHQRY